MGNKNYSKGISWFNDCRIPFVDEGDIPNDMDKTHLNGRNFYTQIYNGFLYQQNTQGRFPANILVCDDMLNDGTTSKQSNRFYAEGTGGQGFYSVKSNGRKQSGDKGTNSRYYDIDKWFNNLVNG